MSWINSGFLLWLGRRVVLSDQDVVRRNGWFLPDVIRASFVWWDTLRHFRHLLFSQSRSPIFCWQSILDKQCRKREDALIYNQGDMIRHRSCWNYWNVVPISYGKVALAPLVLRLCTLSASISFLPLDRSAAFWWSQVTKLVTFSSFPRRCISLPKFASSLGSSLDKSLDVTNGASEASRTGHSLSTDIEVA